MHRLKLVQLREIQPQHITKLVASAGFGQMQEDKSDKSESYEILAKSTKLSLGWKVLPYLPFLCFVFGRSLKKHVTSFLQGSGGFF